LIIDLIRAGQVDQVDHAICGSRQCPGNASIIQFVWEVDTELYGAYPRPELGNLAVALEENPDIDGIIRELVRECSDAR
jgi:hypothetical protein